MIEYSLEELTSLMFRIEDIAQNIGLRNFSNADSEYIITAQLQGMLYVKANVEDVLRHDGSVYLTSNWDIGESRKILSEKIEARSNLGLSLFEASGAGIFIKDGGNVGIKTANPLYDFHITGNGFVSGISYLGSANNKALSSSVATREIYVDQSTGNDSTGTGASGAPYATIGKAVSVLPDAIIQDTNINIGAGAYDEAIDLTGKAVFGKSLSFRGRTLADKNLYATGTATSGGNDTLTDSGKTWDTNLFAGGKIVIRAGLGVGQERTISSNTSTEITVSSNWTTNPDSTSQYTVYGAAKIETASKTIAFTISGVNNSGYSVKFIGIQINGYSTYGINAKDSTLRFEYCYLNSTRQINLNHCYAWITYSTMKVGTSTYGGFIADMSLVDLRYTVFIAQSAGVGTAITLRGGLLMTPSTGSNNYFLNLAVGFMCMGGAQKLYTYNTYVGCSVDKTFSDMEMTLANITGDLDHDGTQIGFFGTSPITKQTALTASLTTITHTEPGTPDYAIQDFTQTTPFGFVSKDEANTVLKVIARLQTRVGELETKLKAYGLLS